MRNALIRCPALVRLALTLLAVMASRSGTAQEPSQYLSSSGRHPLLSADMPPGAVGGARALGRGPVRGYFQPVAFSGPGETEFSLAQGGAFQPSQPSLMAGLLVGQVYRFKITGIPRAEGAELFPTVELIDRTYPPPGLATSYPIPINLDLEDLQAALEGKLVTRVVYLEDPQTALAVAETPSTSRAMDIAPDQDALQVADRFGRPVAIVRIGSLTPPRAPALRPRFFFGYPTWAPIFPADRQPSHSDQQPSKP